MTTILFVDDEPEEFEQAIERAGYQLSVARDGAQGWKNLKSEGSRYDLIIIDINLPKINGLELLQRIRSEDQFHHIPIILLSFLHQDEIYVSGLKKGADVYLTKPITHSKLLAAIEAILRRTEQQRTPPSENGATLKQPLSKRELEILKCIADGLTNQQIAEKLFLAEVTIKNHTSSIYKKLGAANRTQAALLAKKLNLC